MMIKQLMLKVRQEALDPFERASKRSVGAQQAPQAIQFQVRR